MKSARLSYEEAAAYLAIKIATLRSLVCRRQIPHVRLTPRLVVFDREQLDAWIAERTVTVERTAAGGQP